MPIPQNWRSALLDERQHKEIAFAEVYTRDFHHGTTGHNALLLIARLALLLDVAVGNSAMPEPPPAGEIVLTFGKHNGKTLNQVWAVDPGYVEWLAKEGRDPDVRAAAQSFAGGGTESPDDGELPF